MKLKQCYNSKGCKTVGGVIIVILNDILLSKSHHILSFDKIKTKLKLKIYCNISFLHALPHSEIIIQQNKHKYMFSGFKTFLNIMKLLNGSIFYAL